MRISEALEIYKEVRRKPIEDLTREELVARTYGDLLERKRLREKRKNQLYTDVHVDAVAKANKSKNIKYVRRGR